MSFNLSSIITVFLLISITLCSFNLSDSKSYSTYAAIAHCPSKAVESWSCKLCPNVSALVNVTYIQNTKTKIVGFVGYQHATDSIIYSFRCTENVANYFEDFSYLQVPFSHCKNCKIHVGFFEAWKSIESKVHSTAKSLLAAYPNAKIISIGHSLGGAIATITALELQIQYNKVKQLHTFGAPRVGDAYFAQFLDIKLPSAYRVVHYKDLAPHLPFEANGYRHQPREVLFDEKMINYQICDTSGEDPDCSNRYFPDYHEKYHMTYFILFDCV